MRKTQYILPVVVGIMSGMILQVFGEQGIHLLYPLPEGAGLNNKEALEAFIVQLPMTAFLLLLANYAVCSFIAGLAATLISGRKTMLPAIITGGVLTLAGIYNIVLLPHQPVWFSACSLLSNILFPLLGYMAAKGKN